MAKPREPDSAGRGASGDRSSGGFKVGKGCPPPDKQWKPNQSGNPKGRKKGSKNRKTIVRDAERRTVAVKVAGRPKKMTFTELGMRNLQQEIAQGNRAAFVTYLEITERYGDSGETASTMQDLAAEDAEIIANMLARKAAQKSVLPSPQKDKEEDDE